jgi:hypothetical protein
MKIDFKESNNKGVGAMEVITPLSPKKQKKKK